MADLKTNLLGFTMNSPIIGASGTVGYGVEYEELAEFQQDRRHLGQGKGLGDSQKGRHGNGSDLYTDLLQSDCQGQRNRKHICEAL